VEVDEVVLASLQGKAIDVLRRHVEAINSGDKHSAMQNLVAAEAFPRAAEIYWERALGLRPLVLSEIVAQRPRFRVRNGESEMRVFVEGHVGAPSCRPVPFGFSVLLHLDRPSARIAGRLPVHELKSSVKV
jgi:hypothetical protein